MWTRALSSYAQLWTRHIAQHPLLTIKGVSARRIKRWGFNREALGPCCLGIITLASFVTHAGAGQWLRSGTGRGRGAEQTWAEIIVIFCHGESHQRDRFPVSRLGAARLCVGMFWFSSLVWASGLWQMLSRTPETFAVTLGNHISCICSS